MVAVDTNILVRVLVDDPWQSRRSKPGLLGSGGGQRGKTGIYPAAGFDRDAVGAWSQLWL